MRRESPPRLVAGAPLTERRFALQFGPEEPVPGLERIPSIPLQFSRMSLDVSRHPR